MNAADVIGDAMRLDGAHHEVNRDAGREEDQAGDDSHRMSEQRAGQIAERFPNALGLVRLVDAALRSMQLPRLGRESWRGPAYELYLVRVEAIASRLRSAAGELADAVDAARTEVLDAAG